MKNDIIRARVDAETKQRLQQCAQEQGLTESAYLRKLIKRQMGAFSMRNTQAGWIPDGQAREKITITLPRFIVGLARDRAMAKEMSLSRWIANLVQSQVFQPPVVTTEELLALNENSRQIRSMGINVNQIAKALNRNHSDLRRLADLVGIERQLKENQKSLTRLIAAVNRSWSVKHDTHR